MKILQHILSAVSHIFFYNFSVFGFSISLYSVIVGLALLYILWKAIFRLFK